MPRRRTKPFQRTIATPRIDPDFESWNTWVDEWTPHSVQERAIEADAPHYRR